MGSQPHSSTPRGSAPAASAVRIRCTRRRRRRTLRVSRGGRLGGASPSLPPAAALSLAGLPSLPLDEELLPILDTRLPAAAEAAAAPEISASVLQPASASLVSSSSQPRRLEGRATAATSRCSAKRDDRAAPSAACPSAASAGPAAAACGSACWVLPSAASLSSGELPSKAGSEVELAPQSSSPAASSAMKRCGARCIVALKRGHAASTTSAASAATRRAASESATATAPAAVPAPAAAPAGAAAARGATKGESGARSMGLGGTLSISAAQRWPSPSPRLPSRFSRRAAHAGSAVCRDTPCRNRLAGMPVAAWEWSSRTGSRVPEPESAAPGPATDVGSTRAACTHARNLAS